MRLPQTFLFLLTFFTTIHALALPASLNSISDSAKELFKRKGGGGGGGRGGGGGSSGGGRSSGGGGSSSGRTGTNSNVGGATSRGSGPQPSYGGGRYYGGGATVPYAAGARSRGGVGPAPLFLGGAALVAFPGIWLYGAYAYGYPYYWTYRNNTSGQNETHPAQCLCAARASCGCDDQVNSTEYQNSVANDKSVAQLARINDTDTLVINGTLPNGTTAAGGTDDDESAAFGMKQGLAQAVGYWPLIAGVAYTMWFM